MNLENISNDWTGSTRRERRIIKGVLKREATPAAVKYFAKMCSDMGDYWYWFILSTIWVSYSGWSDLELWKKLFSSKRDKIKSSIMKPDELLEFYQLTNTVTAYRAHRENEKDWISYTINQHAAEKFSRQRGVDKISKYRLYKSDLVALFLRRGESELIMLTKRKADKICDIPLTNTTTKIYI